MKKPTEQEIFTLLQDENKRRKLAAIPTPAYLIDEEKLRANGEILKCLSERTGCKILLAQKAFSNYDLYPVLSEYLAGTEASGLYEARLGAEEMSGKEVHVFCAAYRDDEFEELLRYADHIVFNSPTQLKRFGKRAKQAGKSVGLRLNPEHSTQDEHAIYDPCAPGSRLGTTRSEWIRQMDEESVALLDGVHFHTLCEQDADALAETYAAFERQYADLLPELKWINFGGGHHITRQDYVMDVLEECIRKAQKRFGADIYLEPGEACALHAGLLATHVLDIVTNGKTQIAILDASAACHMPDVIEMPYRPPLYGGDVSGGKAYMLAGPTCLAGDVIGTYTFAEELQIGDVLFFGDMAIYTTCKNNTFNGMPLPDIWRVSRNGKAERLTGFGYSDFKSRLGRKC
ncbi:MAG: carboxynorspermidine decarboxylase [Lachnospiraceae bacterium]|nr:carboxynorspermidine decarboxylase [Lachnospiraceae bacterium]